MGTLGDLNDIRIAKEIDVLRDVAPIVQISQKVGRFMITADKERQEWRLLLPAEILGETSKSFEFLGALESIEISFISQRLCEK